MTGRKNKCVRKNCNNQVFSVKMAVEKRLCRKHYERFCELKKRREQNPVHRLNEALPRKIKGPKSKKKLVKEREIINSRKKHKQEQGPSLAEVNKKVREILKTPAWRTLETRIRRNGITFKSKAELDALSELYAIYSWVSYCKRGDNYSVWFLNCPDVNINLHVCECRSSESDCYLPSRFIILPAPLRQKVKRKYSANSSGVPGHNDSKSLYKTVLSVCGGKRETELFFYSLPVKTNHHPYWIKSGVVKRFSPVFGLLFYEQERLIGGVFRYVLIRFYNTFKENLFFVEIVSCCFLVELFHDIDSFFINQRLSKLESFIDKWKEGKEIWIKAYLQLIHNTLGITETEKLVNLYNSFFTDKVVLWDESVKKVKWIYEK
ncbi:hypothetical protein [Escherichia coli]|uniref:hypothetical protein n=1 Tax=Escherichia coli TaxID=562 RepID=UPI001F0E80A5|nr:hypothetical protein [Escherichia coli]UMR91147.1 hypothetical protein AOY89_21545 [Escherichia coli]